MPSLELLDQQRVGRVERGLLGIEGALAAGAAPGDGGLGRLVVPVAAEAVDDAGQQRRGALGAGEQRRDRRGGRRVGLA